MSGILRFNILIFFLWTVQSMAATITLTSPVSAMNIADGEDFFTDVMHNPIDFDKRRDILWEEHFIENTIGTSDGTWSGTVDGHINGGYVFPFFQGIQGALNSGLTGLNYPLDTTKYRYVSVMDRVSDRTLRRMYWTRDGNWPTTLKTTGVDETFQTGQLGETDGYCTDTKTCHYSTDNTHAIYHDPDTWVIYLIDLRSKNDWTDAPVTGIRFDASPKASAGTVLDYRWFRVIDPDSSPLLEITWNATDFAEKDAKVNIYIDNDNSGFDGAFLTRVSVDDGVFSFPTAALPAGKYYIYLKLFDNIGNDTLLATSSYSAPVTINAKSSIDFINPSQTSGVDYASKVVENPWDMDNSGIDVSNLGKPEYQKCFIDELFTSGIFEATAVIVGEAKHTDAQVWMNTSEQNPIDTTRYRYLTYTLAADGTDYGNISDKVKRGWVTRLVWWTDGLSIDGEQTNDNVLYEGIHTYTIDLYGDVIEPDSTLSGLKWQDNPTVAHLRIDPLETSNTGGTRFFLYDVKLTAVPVPDTDNIFSSTFIINDLENNPVSVQFFLDNDNMGYNGKYLGRMTFSNGQNSFTFQTCGFDVGDYFLYAVLIDTFGNKSYRYANAPIHIGTSIPCDRVDYFPSIINYLLN